MFFTSFGCSLINTPAENWLTLGSAMNGLMVTGIAVGDLLLANQIASSRKK
jgi:hypothetical protein